MEPGEVVGYLGAFAVFLIGGILLIVFGCRRLSRRSAIRRQQQYGPPVAYQPPSPYGAQSGQAPYGQPPYASGQPNPYAPQAMTGTKELATKKPPNLALSIVMIVLGALLTLASLSTLAQSAGGSA